MGPSRSRAFLSCRSPDNATLAGLSGITWAGFPVFYYLFTYEDTRDAFSIPYDIDILKEVCVKDRSSRSA